MSHKNKKSERIKESNNQNKGWSQDEDLELIDLYKTKSYSEIGAIMGRTPASCSARMYSLKKGSTINVSPSQLNSRKIWTWEEDQTVLELTHKGRTPLSISRQIKRTEIATIMRIQTLKKKGIVYNPNAVKPKNLVPKGEYDVVFASIAADKTDENLGKIKRTKKTYSLEEKIDIVKRYRESNMTMTSFGKSIGVPHNNISVWARTIPEKRSIPTDFSSDTGDSKNVREKRHYSNNYKLEMVRKYRESGSTLKEFEGITGIKKSVMSSWNKKFGEIESPTVDIKENVPVHNIHVTETSNLQKILDSFKGVKGTTILVIHQD
jgi:transposase-like protein